MDTVKVLVEGDLRARLRIAQASGKFFSAENEDEAIVCAALPIDDTEEQSREETEALLASSRLSFGVREIRQAEQANDSAGNR